MVMTSLARLAGKASSCPYVVKRAGGTSANGWWVTGRSQPTPGGSLDGWCRSPYKCAHLRIFLEKTELLGYASACRQLAPKLPVQ